MEAHAQGTQGQQGNTAQQGPNAPHETPGESFLLVVSTVLLSIFVFGSIK
jgi:hypothetical protein